jgi:DNA polymerase-3 subunit delta'
LISDSVHGFDQIFSQTQPLRTLKGFLQKDAIPHALLFTGIAGIGKRMTATAFAMAANCLETKPDITSYGKNPPPGDKGTFADSAVSPNPCERCSSCKKIRSGNHPDIIFIEPDGAMIKIHQIRDLLGTLALKPYEARVRFVIIAESHTMNPSAANALLKVLEEPPDRTIFILTATEASTLLPTILSRCRRVRFNPVSRPDIVRLLQITRGIDPEQGKTLAAMAEGSFGRVLSMSRSNWGRRRKWLIIAGGLENPHLLSGRSRSSLLAFSEELAKSKSTVGDSIAVMKTWFRDLVVWKYAPGKIINQDLADQVRCASANSTVEALLKKIEVLEQAQRDVATNMNLRLSLDLFMLRLGEP